MKALSIAFGALALIAASVTTSVQAKADSFGVYVGSNGFGIQVSSYGGYGGHYGPAYYGGGGCYDPYYRAYVPCGYSNYYPRPYYSGYYERPRFHRRHQRFVPYGWFGHHRPHWDNRWRGHRGLRHGDWGGRHHGWGGRHHGGRRH
ncbi:MAG: hypothetical protein K8S25_07915 [Alphaproteobacteria bacterium]|nr:hypothetical protein [Alphaproteobacteria bacterium]